MEVKKDIIFNDGLVINDKDDFEKSLSESLIVTDESVFTKTKKDSSENGTILNEN